MQTSQLIFSLRAEHRKTAEAYCNSVAEGVGRQRIRVDALQTHARHYRSEDTSAKNKSESNFLLQWPFVPIQGLDGQRYDPEVCYDVHT